MADQFATLFDAVLDHAGSTPEAPAVSDQDCEVSYAQLAQRVCTMASALGKAGALEQDRIGILLENSVDYIVAILACQFKRFVFVPLPISDPIARLQIMTRDAGLSVCVTNESRKSEVENWASFPVLAVEELAEQGPTAVDLSASPIPADPETLAYCVYTSGTTGAPKGVLIRNMSILHLAESTAAVFATSPETRAMCISPFHFDGAFGSIFSVLLMGGSLVIAPSGPKLPRQLIDLIANKAITHTSFSPSMLALLLRAKNLSKLANSRLITIGLGGEDLSREDVLRFKAAVPHVRIFNRYGPTETTVAVSSLELTPEVLQRPEKVPIGRAGDGVAFWLRPIEGGNQKTENKGELCISGIQVMVGYRNDPEATANVLRSDIVSGSVVYCTGDLVEINRYDEYAYLDRLDNVINRGANRISLAEITRALLQIDGVDDAQCVAPQRDGELQIVAIVVASELDRAEIAAMLGRLVPSYMMPDRIKIVSELTRLPTGKIDANALV
ncbi:AMP-binding protein [Erythrobacter sp.]|uniref:AMP-binding protein n=1 Tax=Erythrobacter sp. TaxID=1042 RepID=UPI003C74E4D6